jgi:phenylpropionate dioxygenase-like ring-hydroxylating dioxygenase large terminal subunit
MRGTPNAFSRSMLDDPLLLNDWHVVGRASDFREGEVRAARLLGVDVVLWHNRQGIHAWLDLCRHRGAKLSLGKVQDERLVCAYHGWCYDGTGACTCIPAHSARTSEFNAKARVFQVRVRYGLVWVCLGSPAAEVPPFPEWDDPSYRKVPAGPYRFRAYAPRVLEDFLDAGHYPFVHAGQMAGSRNFEMEGYGVRSTDSGLVSDEIGVRRIWRDGPGGTGEVGVVYSYRVHRPLTAQYTKSYGAERFSMLDTVTPVDECESLVWSVMAFNYPPGKSDEALVEYQDTLAAQDVPIVESQRPQRLPLDMGQEIAVPSDSLAVAYRQWLRRLGLKFGTS